MKRLFVLLLSGVMLASSISMDSYAAVNTTAAPDIAPVMIKKEDPASYSDLEPTNEGLEAVILAVKNKISIPKEYSEFNYYFNNTNSYADSYWSLTWRNPSTSSYIQVNCDASNHITYFSQYDYSKKTSGIAKYFKNELVDEAEAFIKKIAPEVANKMEYVDANYDGIYSGNYVYNFTRKNNRVEFPDNRVTVWVNSITGEVTSASISWLYGVAVPSADVKITKEEAAKLIKENMKMKLVYRSDYYGIYSDWKRNPDVKNAYLVYEPTVNYISIDAKTGKLYLTRSEWIDTSANNGEYEKAADQATASASAAEVTLTEEEIVKINDLKKLITKAKAIETITGNPYLHLDKNLKSYTATLSKRDDGNGDTSYVWSINLNDPREIDYNSKTSDNYRAYAYATVDAETGKILSYYASVKSYYDEVNQKWTQVKIPYDRDKSKGILETFLGTQIPERFKNSVLVNQQDDYVAFYKNENEPVFGGYSYSYNRTNEGVEYPYNNIFGSVDGVTGKIYSYGSYWDNNITFEATKGAITPEEAMNYYLDKEGFGLKYEINVINKYDSKYNPEEKYYDYSKQYSVDYEIRLVYRPDITPAAISPFTGEQLNYDGSVFKKTKPYTYLDIKDTEKYRDILLLADMNIGFEGESFNPDRAITEKEINELLQKVGYGYGYDTKSANADEPITREEVAQTFISRLGLEKVAKLSGIYKTGYADENVIASEYVGAVALAKGLGLMEADANNNFNAKLNITRADAVKLILNFIEAQQNGIYY